MQSLLVSRSTQWVLSSLLACAGMVLGSALANERDVKNLTISKNVEVGVILEDSPYTTVDELQIRGIAALHAKFGFVYSNAWTAQLNFDATCLSNSPAFTLRYVMSVGQPQYRVEFDKRGLVTNSKCYSVQSSGPTINVEEMTRGAKELIRRQAKP
jgi:hypothetical protein